jgi:tetratricopeptide (TPR) repeat protein
MQGITRKVPRYSKVRTRAGFLALAIALALIAGCASGGKVRTEPVEPAPSGAAEHPVPQRPAVTRLADGREGFVIREIPNPDADVRRDFERSVALLEGGDFEGAAALLEQVIEGAPGVTAPYINIARAYGAMGRPEAAERHLKTALDLFPDHPAASNEYGLLLRKSGRFAEARETYEKTLASFPEYLPARRNIGILCDLYLKDWACALEQYEIYSEARPDDEQVKVWIADLQLRAGVN